MVANKKPVNKKQNDKNDNNYFDNLAKEFKQFMKSRAKANDAEFNARYQKNLAINPDARTVSKAQNQKAKAIKKETNAKGQLAGALLQGRRYNTTTNKQVKKKK